MDRELASDAIADHLGSNPEHRAHLMSTEPAPRPVDVQSRTWDVWLRDGGRVGSTSYVGPLDPKRVAAAADARRDLNHRDPGRRGADREIDRSHLVTLAERAAKGNERRCITLWVASMMWGSGTLNGRGPWRTAQGLAADDLGSILTQSHRHLRAGELAEAYDVASLVPGSGESYFTKWLWAASLGLDLDRDLDGERPRILDTGVRASLARIRVRPAHSAAGYLDYVAAIETAATKLRTSTKLRGATPEKVEWLLSLEAP